MSKPKSKKKFKPVKKVVKVVKKERKPRVTLSSQATEIFELKAQLILDQMAFGKVFTFIAAVHKGESETDTLHDLLTEAKDICMKAVQNSVGKEATIWLLRHQKLVKAAAEMYRHPASTLAAEDLRDALKGVGA